MPLYVDHLDFENQTSDIAEDHEGDFWYNTTAQAFKARLAGSVIATFATLAGGAFTGDISVPDEAYGSGWNGSMEVPTKNALWDKIETLAPPKVYYQVYPMNSAQISITTSVTNLTNQSNSPPCPKTGSYKLRCAVVINAVTGASTVFTFQTASAVSCVKKSPAGSPPPATAETTLFAANTALGTFTKSGNFAAGDAFYVESSAFNLTAGDVLKYGGNTVGIFAAAKINTGTSIGAMISVTLVEQ